MRFGLLALPETGPLELSASMVTSMSVLVPAASESTTAGVGGVKSVSLVNIGYSSDISSKLVCNIQTNVWLNTVCLE